MTGAVAEVSGRRTSSSTRARARAWRAPPGATDSALDHFAARLFRAFAVRAGEGGCLAPSSCWPFLACANSSRRTLGGVPKPPEAWRPLNVFQPGSFGQSGRFFMAESYHGVSDRPPGLAFLRKGTTFRRYDWLGTRRYCSHDSS